mmetsp:Transcript_8805/g.10531  ORF Transcript_8805/g.10531 Transcript_8805/m.10531 type:complete len:425 (-) Transcript_8805:82-1356(-)
MLTAGFGEQHHLAAAGCMKRPQLPEWDHDLDGVPRLALISSREAHGSLGNRNWKRPVLIMDSKGVATNQELSSLRGDEFEDEAEVLDAKVKILANLLKQSKHCVAYTGRGIFSRGSHAGSIKKSPIVEEHSTNDLLENDNTQSPVTYQALATLNRFNYIAAWIEQNQNGFAQKAGMSQGKLTEIHGSRYDPSNPLVKKFGEARPDLCRTIEDECDKVDLCLALGTSLYGKSSDRIAILTGRKAEKKVKNIIGTVVINPCRTGHDNLSCLRIYASVDTVFRKLMERLKLPLGSELHCCFKRHNNSSNNAFCRKESFRLPYAKDGTRLMNSKTQGLMLLNLSVGSELRVTDGAHKGEIVKVVSREKAGHWQLQLTTGPHVGEIKYLGLWWVQEASYGRVQKLPLVNKDPEFQPHLSPGCGNNNLSL